MIEFEGKWNPRQMQLMYTLASMETTGNLDEICQAAGWTRQGYWNLMRTKPEFGRDLERLSFELMRSDLPDVYKALIREAKKGSAPHIRTALEAAGRVGGGNKQIVNVTQNAGSGDELSDFLERREAIVTQDEE